MGINYIPRQVRFSVERTVVFLVIFHINNFRMILFGRLQSVSVASGLSSLKVARSRQSMDGCPCWVSKSKASIYC